MWDKIIQICLALCAVVLTRYAIPAINAYLKGQNADNLTDTIDSLVAAAEQLYKDMPKSGEQKLVYVKDRLIEQGIVISNAVSAQIEAAVYRLPETTEENDNGNA